MPLVVKDEISFHNINFLIKVYEERRTSVRASIREKNINIRLPYRISSRQKKIEVAHALDWAENFIKNNFPKFKHLKHKGYKNKDRLKVGKEEFTLNLKIYENTTNTAHIKDHHIYINLCNELNYTEQQAVIRKLLGKVLGKYRLPHLQQLIKKLNAKHFHKKLGKISFRDKTSNWGSCSSQGNISISTKLIFAPDKILEYICVHELAHLIEMNHSKKFWKLVASVIPDFQSRELWLEKYGDRCNF